MYLHKILLLLPLVGLISCSSSPNRAKPVGNNFTSGTIRLGGDLGYSTNGTGTMDGSARHLNGNAGYFVTDKVELGGSVNIEDVNKKHGSANLEAVSFAVYARAYSTTVGPLRTFAELGVGMGSVDAGPASVDFSTFQLSIGMLEFISKSVAVELALEETFYFFDSPNPDGSGLAINLGVSWYL
jgi:hypothetical protein